MPRGGKREGAGRPRVAKEDSWVKDWTKVRVRVTTRSLFDSWRGSLTEDQGLAKLLQSAQRLGITADD